MAPGHDAPQYGAGALSRVPLTVPTASVADAAPSPNNRRARRSSWSTTTSATSSHCRPCLERGHADVIVAESGAEALVELERTPDIDIVLMDIMMPIMDGYDTMRAIRALEQFKNLPIIAVTGKVMPGERQRCIDAGANDYVPKPVDTAELVAALRPWLPTTAQPTAA